MRIPSHLTSNPYCSSLGGNLVLLRASIGRISEGIGFTEQTLALLKRELEPLRRDSSPFAGRQPPKGTVFVDPSLVARVEFREWTGSGTLRAPSFKGLRPDISPQECVREEG